MYTACYSLFDQFLNGCCAQVRFIGNTGLAYVARMRCLFGLFALETLVANCGAWSDYYIIEIANIACSAFPRRHVWALVHFLTLGLGLVLPARVVSRTHLLVGILFTFLDTVKKCGACRAWERCAMLN